MAQVIELGIAELQLQVRWTPHPVIVTIRDIGDYIRALVYSYYNTITGWEVLSYRDRQLPSFTLPTREGRYSCAQALVQRMGHGYCMNIFILMIFLLFLLLLRLLVLVVFLFSVVLVLFLLLLMLLLVLLLAVK